MLVNIFEGKLALIYNHYFIYFRHIIAVDDEPVLRKPEYLDDDINQYLYSVS